MIQDIKLEKVVSGPSLAKGSTDSSPSGRLTMSGGDKKPRRPEEKTC